MKRLEKTGKLDWRAFGEGAERGTRGRVPSPKHTDFADNLRMALGNLAQASKLNAVRGGFLAALLWRPVFRRVFDD